MKQLLKHLSFLAIILLIACDSDNGCEGKECFTEPEAILFEFIDRDTGENLVANGTFKEDEFKVINTASMNNIEFGIVPDGSNANMLSILGIGWETEQVNCTVTIGDEELLTLFVDAAEVIEDCCRWTRYNEITIENADYVLDEDTGIYTIKID